MYMSCVESILCKHLTLVSIDTRRTKAKLRWRKLTVHSLLPSWVATKPMVPNRASLHKGPDHHPG